MDLEQSNNLPTNELFQHVCHLPSFWMVLVGFGWFWMVLVPILGIILARPNHAQGMGWRIYSTATRIPPGRAWEAKVIIISTEGLHNKMLNGGA